MKKSRILACQNISPRKSRASSTQHAQRQAAAAQTAGIGASAFVDTKLLCKPVAFDWRETSWRSFKFQFVAYSSEGSAGSGRIGRGGNAQHPHGPGHASSQRSAVTHADHCVPGRCAVMKKFDASMGCPRYQNGTSTHTHAYRARMLSSIASQPSVAPQAPVVDMAVDRQGARSGR